MLILEKRSTERVKKCLERKGLAQMNLRIRKEMKENIIKMAAAENISTNDLLNELLKIGIERRSKNEAS